MVYVVCAAFYTVFASSDVQEWNDVPASKSEQAGKKKPESPKMKEIKKEFQNLAFEFDDNAKKKEQQ